MLNIKISEIFETSSAFVPTCFRFRACVLICIQLVDTPSALRLLLSVLSWGPHEYVISLEQQVDFPSRVTPFLIGQK